MDTSNTSAAHNLMLPVPRSVGGRRCAAQHFGAWAVKPQWFRDAVARVRDGTWKPSEPRAGWDDDDDTDPNDGVYTVVNRVAVIHLDGQMTKYGSSFGGCSTIAVRKAVRLATADPTVKAIMLHVCSPGGTVAGTSALAADVAAAVQAKPTDCYISDMACSAAYWVASQCRTVYANDTAEVGSIGTMVVLEDDTGQQEQLGIKLSVVATGEYKGLWASGAVTDKYVADEQRLVNDLNVPFLAGVAAGRGDRISDVGAVADGRVHVAAQAKQLGLIDQVASFDVAMNALSTESQTMTDNEFTAHAQANPAAVQRFIDQGHAAGHAAGRTAGQADGIAAERARFDELAEMASEHPAFVVEQFKAGATVAVAAKAYAALVKREAQQAKTLDPSNGVPPLNAPRTDGSAASDPEQEWAANVGGVQQQFRKKEQFLALRKHQSRIAALPN